MSEQEPVLCYIRKPWAFFTPLPLSKQTGDDWDDAPYEHNAGPPYESDAQRRPVKIVRLAFMVDMETAADRADGNFRYSVDQINAGQVAWLARSRWTTNVKCPIAAIMAGTTLSDFKRAIRANGGEVYVLEVEGVEP